MSDETAQQALQKYQAESGTQIYVNETDLRTQRMFVAVVTKIPVVKSDFHDTPVNGKMMPQAHHVHRIAIAAGITFETVHMEKDETSWTTTVRAFRRDTDGTIAHVDGSCNYDWVDRKSEGGLKKFALQRAETGAQLRAIRKILGIPTAFDRDNFERAIVVCRIDVNTDAMLDDPGMREAAIDHALAAGKSLFGPRDVPLEPTQIEAPDADGFETADEPAIDLTTAPEVETNESWGAVVEYESAYNLSPKAVGELTEVRRKFSAGERETLTDEYYERLLRRIRTWCDKNPEARR